MMIGMLRRRVARRVGARRGSRRQVVRAARGGRTPAPAARVARVAEPAWQTEMRIVAAQPMCPGAARGTRWK